MWVTVWGRTSEHQKLSAIRDVYERVADKERGIVLFPSYVGVVRWRKVSGGCDDR